MKIKNYILTFGLVSASIITTFFAAHSTAQQAVQKQKEAAQSEYQIGAVLYMQKAAEYRALCYQAFNLAKMNLTADFDKKNLKKLPKSERKMPRAVIVDIDETVLDNSPAQAFNILNSLTFDNDVWYAWGERRSAKAIPGAVDFLKYADSKGVKIFYISNRDADPQQKATMDNLVQAGFPDVSEQTVLLRQNRNSSKSERRMKVAKDYRVVLLIGDNLDDFADDFERIPTVERFAETDKDRQMFGDKYIVLPNAMYGSWERAIYDKTDTTETLKAAKRRAALESY